MVNFSASVICMDPCNLFRDIQFLDYLGVKYLHIDMMDGHNVPRYGIYPEILRRISYITDMKMDVHLMVNDPEFCISQLEGIKNISALTFHIEGREGNILRILDSARKITDTVGIAINMSTGNELLIKLLKHGYMNAIMFMAIHPGVLKQTSRPQSLYTDMPEVLQYANDYPLSYIAVDGGVSFDTIQPLIAAGANFLIGGSGTIYKNVDFNAHDDIIEQRVDDNWNEIKKRMCV